MNGGSKQAQSTSKISLYRIPKDMEHLVIHPINQLPRSHLNLEKRET